MPKITPSSDRDERRQETIDPTGPLSRFIHSLSYSDIPEHVRRRVHLITVDAIANALAGWQAQETASIAGLAGTIGGKGSSTVIGGPPLAPAGAALLNAYLITAVSACDVYRPALCHVTPEVIPPALAVAEKQGTSGEQFLLAVAIGLETTVRLGLGLHYSAFRDLGWHSPGVIGPFGGAAAVGKILGLNAEQLRHALGLAGSQASGTFAAFGTAAVKFHQAHGALSGLSAGLAAAEGFKTTDKILVHPDGGLYNTMSDGGNPEAVTRGLGEHWELENISLRLWPTAAALQSVVSVLLSILGRNDVKPQDVDKMRIGLPAAAYKMNGTMGWDKRLNAMLSARYVAAVVLKDRTCWLEQFDAPHLADRAISRFAGSRVEVSIDPATEPDGASVRITCSNGQDLTESRLYPKGDPRDPLTYEDVLTKLHAFGETQLGTSQLRQALPLLERLETSDTIAPLLRELSKNGK